MLNYYYDLINDKQLPPGSRYIDPNTQIALPVNLGDTLVEFTEKVVLSRSNANLPTIEPTELRELIIACLYQSTDPKDASKFFKKISVLPNSHQVSSLALSLAYKLFKGNEVGSDAKRKRAGFCLDNCSFHNYNSLWSKGASKLLKKIIRLDDLKASEEEKQLGTCSMCSDGGVGCNLQAKVAFDLGAVLVGMYPEYIGKMLARYGSESFNKCWIFKEAISSPTYKALFLRKLALVEKGTDLYHAYLTNEMMKSRQKSNVR